MDAQSSSEREFGREVVIGSLDDARPHARTGSALLNEDGWQAVMRRFGLSSREVEIVQSIFDNIKDPEIARQLGISVHTVRTHIERLHRKLGAGNRPGVILAVLDFHLKRP